MNSIIELNEEGGIYLPAKILEFVRPHTRFIVEVQGDVLMLRPEETAQSEKPKQPFWETATPQEQAESFRQWALSFTEGPGLPDEALRRENMYD